MFLHCTVNYQSEYKHISKKDFLFTTWLGQGVEVITSKKCETSNGSIDKYRVFHLLVQWIYGKMEPIEEQIARNSKPSFLDRLYGQVLPKKSPRPISARNTLFWLLTLNRSDKGVHVR